MAIAKVFTISDSRSEGAAVDKSGPLAVQRLLDLGIDADGPVVIPDEVEQIRDVVQAASVDVRLIVTTGGTGVAKRDVTPEAIEPLFDRSLPGFGEIMRTGSYSVTPLSIISRGGAGVIGRCLVVMLPGSPGGVEDGFRLLGPAIRHVLKVLSDQPADCATEQGARNST